MQSQIITRYYMHIELPKRTSSSESVEEVEGPTTSFVTPAFTGEVCQLDCTCAEVALPAIRASSFASFTGKDGSDLFEFDDKCISISSDIAKSNCVAGLSAFCNDTPLRKTENPNTDFTFALTIVITIIHCTIRNPNVEC